MAWGSPSNISPGGHTYDRTTGTWAGEGVGTVGDGIDRSSAGEGSRVIHDANGPVGVFFASPAAAALATGWTPEAPAAQPSGGVGAGANAPASKPGAVAASGGVSPGTALAVATASNRGAFIKDAFTRSFAFSGEDNPVQDAVLGGRHWMANPKASNGEWVEVRYGDSEIVQEVVGLAILGSDIGFNAARVVFGENFQSMGPQARLNALQGMAVDTVKRLPLQATDLVMNIGAGVQSAAEQNKAWERQQQAAKDAFNDAWDYRELLQQQEWNEHQSEAVAEKWRLQNVFDEAKRLGPAPLPN